MLFIGNNKLFICILLRQLYQLIHGSSIQLINICLNQMNAILYTPSIYVYIYPIDIQA